MKKPRVGRPRDSKPPSKDVVRQRMKRLRDKLRDAAEYDYEAVLRERVELMLWRSGSRSWREANANLTNAIKEICKEIVRRSGEIEKLEREIETIKQDTVKYVRDKFSIE
jgi:hypothetical protein